MNDLKYEEFLPALMRRCWDDHKKLRGQTHESDVALVPFSASFYGAVLFADISGFTRLSSSLHAEELKKYINSYFATVLGVIESYSGDVIKFCGDALLVVWPVDLEARAKVKEAAVHMACKCALNLVNKSLAPPTKQKTDRNKQDDFRFHCGVSCGIVHGYVVGSAGRLEFLLSGEPIAEAGDASSEAKLGQVCVSPDAFARVQSKFIAQEMTKGSFLLTEMIHCHPDCFRCTHLSGLYRLSAAQNQQRQQLNSARRPVLTPSNSNEFESPRGEMLSPQESGDSLCGDQGGGGKAGTRVKPPLETRDSFDENIFSLVVRKLKGAGGGAGGDTYKVSPAASPRIVDTPQSSNSNDSAARSTPISIADSDMADQDEMGSAFTTVSRRQTNSSGNSFLKKISSSLFSKSASKEVKITPAEAIGDEWGGRDLSAEVDEQMRSYHVESQRTEAEVSDFLRPYRQQQGSSTATPTILNLYNDAAEKFYGLFVGSMVQIALESDMLEFLAEIKLVATVFIDITGVSDDFSTGSCERPQKAIVCILKALKRCGGFLRQYLVDDKGCVVIAGFGVPGYNHSDDCARAVEAAVAISRSLQHAHMNSRIGIAVGNVYCGLIGSSSRCEYGMMGASVNLAARLMSKCALGKIMVSDAVRVAAKDHFQFEEHASIKAKGFKLLIPVFEPTGRYAGNPMTLKFSVEKRNEYFVGRLEELEQLTAAFRGFSQQISMLEKSGSRSPIRGGRSRQNSAEDGTCPQSPVKSQPAASTRVNAHIVEGSSGMGKTAVISELYFRAMHAGLTTYSAVANPPSYMGISEYDTICQILSAIFSTCCISAQYDDNEKPNAEKIKAQRLSWEADLSKARMGSHTRGNSRSSGAMDEASETELVQLWFDSCATDQDVFTIPLNSRKRTVLVSVRVDKHNTSMSYDSSSSDEEGEELIKFCGSSPPTTPCKGLPDSYPTEVKHDNPDGIMWGKDEITVSALEARCLLNAILPVKFPSCQRIRNLSSNIIHFLRDSLIVFILKRSAELRQMLLVINSIQWCDVASMRVIHKFLKLRIPSCFVLCGLDSSVGLNPVLQPPTRVRTFSQEGSVVDPFEAGGDGSDPLVKITSLCEIHNLKPFGYIETLDLMGKMLGAEFLELNPIFISEHTINKLLHRTSGIPGLLVALITNLKDNGINDWNLDSNALHVSDSSSVDMDTLDPTERFVLKLCSVIGATFLEADAMLLANKVQSSKHNIDMHACLESLTAKHFLVGSNVPATFSSLKSAGTPYSSRSTSSANGESQQYRYHFPSSHMHDSVYNMMLKNQKTKTHSAYAAILEQRPHSSVDQIDLIIYHYLRSGNQSKKFEFLNDGLKETRGLSDSHRIMTYLTEVISVWTKGSVNDLLISCCASPHCSAKALSPTKKPMSSEVLDKNKDPQEIFRNTRRIRAKKLPPYVGSEDMWLSPYDLTNPYVDPRGEPEWLACWVAERSAILFSHGFLIQGYNEALLALHICGILRSYMFKNLPDKKGQIFVVSDALTPFKLHTLVAISAILVEIAMTLLFFGKFDDRQYYIALSDMVDEFVEQKFPDEIANYDHSFYLYSVHILKRSVRKCCVANDHERQKMLRDIIDQTRSTMDADNASVSHGSSAGSTASHSASPILSNNAGAPTSRSVSRSVSRSSFGSAGNAVNVSGYNVGSPLCTPIMTGLSNQDVPVHVKSLMASTAGHVNDSILLQVALAASEGRFAVANAAFSILRAQLEVQPFANVLGKYAHILTAWSSFLSGKVARAIALVTYLQEYALAFGQVILYRWITELGMLQTVMCGIYEIEALTNNLDAQILEIRNVTHRDSMSSCTCAIYSFALALGSEMKYWARSISLAKFAVNRLSKSHAPTLTAGICLFLAGHAAVLLMQHDNVRVNCMPLETARKHRDKSPRLFQNSQAVVEKALDALSRMASTTVQPCLILLYDALSLKAIGAMKKPDDHKLNESIFDLPLTASLKTNERNSITYLYPEFTFGLAFLQIEQLHYIKAKGPSFRSPINVKLLEVAVKESFAKLKCAPETYTRFPGPDSILSYLITMKLNLPLLQYGNSNSLTISVSIQAAPSPLTSARDGRGYIPSPLQAGAPQQIVGPDARRNEAPLTFSSTRDM